MKDYVATFHTHLAALQTSRTLMEKGASARLMPVPRKLSASCGTCVSYTADSAMEDAMDVDVEAIFEKLSRDQYTLVRQYD